MILLHGTTLHRAEQIIACGPDPCFCEPGGRATQDGFSSYLVEGPFLFGAPDRYAHAKATQFPDEGGPVILLLDVPIQIVLKSVSDWFPLDQSLVQFDLGSGLEELLEAWPEIAISAMIRRLI